MRKRKIEEISQASPSTAEAETVTPREATTTSSTTPSTRLPNPKGIHSDDAYTKNEYLICGDKFYEISIVGKTLVTTWGKIGTFGTKLEMSLCSELACENHLTEKVKEKIRKGYMKVERPEPTPLALITHEVKLLKNDTPHQAEFYNKWYTVTQRSINVFIRDGFHNERFTTTHKSFKTEVAARKFLDKTVLEARGKGYEVVVPN